MGTTIKQGFFWGLGFFAALLGVDAGTPKQFVNRQSLRHGTSRREIPSHPALLRVSSMNAAVGRSIRARQLK